MSPCLVWLGYAVGVLGRGLKAGPTPSRLGPAELLGLRAPSALDGSVPRSPALMVALRRRLV